VTSTVAAPAAVALPFTQQGRSLLGSIFKGSRLEQLFRDRALAPLQPPQADFCLWNMSMFELNLDLMVCSHRLSPFKLGLRSAVLA
jgi:hypothetical protein